MNLALAANCRYTPFAAFSRVGGGRTAAMLRISRMDCTLSAGSPDPNRASTALRIFFVRRSNVCMNGTHMLSLASKNLDMSASVS